jgi:hypothetical protein
MRLREPGDTRPYPHWPLDNNINDWPERTAARKSVLRLKEHHGVDFDASWRELEEFVGGFFGLPEYSTWTTIFQTVEAIYQQEEQDRKRCAQLLDLKPSATWVEIIQTRYALEHMREEGLISEQLYREPTDEGRREFAERHGLPASTPWLVIYQVLASDHRAEGSGRSPKGSE